MSRTYGDVAWELDEVTDEDVDGSGTHEVLITGQADCAEGGGTFILTASAMWAVPYAVGSFDEIKIDDEEFVPDEMEPEYYD